MQPDDYDQTASGGELPVDPREALRRDPARQEPSPGLLYLRTIAAEERQWLEKMVVGVAAEYRVDRDDLLQDLRLSLLRCTSIDAGRAELHAWLRRRAEWKALDLLRKTGRHPTQSLELGPEPPAPEPNRIDPDWDVDSSWHLSRDEAQIVRLICWGEDDSMREISALMGYSYDKGRQVRSRALRKLKKLIDLTPDELAAWLALGRLQTYPEAAIKLGLPEEELRVRVRRAEEKIRRVLRRSATDEPEEGGRSDAS